jgi:hypothetical protein
VKTASALTVAAIGAILVFATSAHPSWLNLHAVGWVLIVTGALGAFVPRRGRSWLRRRVTVSQSGETTTVERRGKRRSRLLVAGGLFAEDPPAETIDSYIEE